MKAYSSLFRIRFIHSLQYRASVIGSILKGFLYAMMQILAYEALYKANGPECFPMEYSQIVTYVWMSESCIILFKVVFGDGDIYSAISSGTIACDLVRPIGLYGKWFVQSAAGRLSFTMINCFPLLLIGFVMPKQYRPQLPPTALQMVLFLLSSVTAFLVVVAFAMLMYISLFYIIAQRGIRIIVTAVTTFLSGGLIPLAIFPKGVLEVVKYLPFAAMQNMPLQIFCGMINGFEACRGILFQLGWLTILILAGRGAMNHSIRRVIVQGG